MHEKVTGALCAKIAGMYWRANDVLIGVITGVFSAVVASLFEVFFVSERFFALGTPSGIGSEVFFIASVGALVGGTVGFAVGAMLKPRPHPR